MRRLKRISIGLLLGIGMMLAGCHRTPDEQAIREALDAAAIAVNQLNASDFADQLGDDFTGNAGELDRGQLVAMLRFARLRHATLHALLGPVTLESRGDRYVARFTVTLSRGGGVLPSEIGVFTVESGWRRQGRDWVCYSSSWTRAM